MFKYYNVNLIKNYRSYSVEQICELYKEKKLHPQTVREWVKTQGLKSITRNPILIYGLDMKEFLNLRNKNNKKFLRFEQFKCLKCKEIFIPLNCEIHIYRNKMQSSIRAVGICTTCFSQSNRFYTKNDEQKLSAIFKINEDDVSILYNTTNTPCKTNQISTKTDGLKELCKKEEIL